MELTHTWSHERGESVLLEKGLGEAYAEAQEAMQGTRVNLASEGAQNSLRIIHDRVLREFARREWRIGERIFPASAPAMFQRGYYRLDAAKGTRTGRMLGVICHFGGSEFLVRQLMLISEAVRRGIVDCAVLALITREAKAYVRGRPACYEQARQLLRSYGQSAFGGVPMVLWGLRPEAMRPGLADAGPTFRAGVW